MDVTFSPLFQQISIGVGAFLVGFLFGVLRNRSRLRAVRRQADERGERLEAELAVERLRIKDLKTRVASYEGDPGEWAAHLEATGLAGGPAAVAKSPGAPTPGAPPVSRVQSSQARRPQPSLAEPDRRIR